MQASFRFEDNTYTTQHGGAYHEVEYPCHYHCADVVVYPLCSAGKITKRNMTIKDASKVTHWLPRRAFMELLASALTTDPLAAKEVKVSKRSQGRMMGGVRRWGQLGEQVAMYRQEGEHMRAMRV